MYHEKAGNANLNKSNLPLDYGKMKMNLDAWNPYSPLKWNGLGGCAKRQQFWIDFGIDLGFIFIAKML